MSWSPPGGTQPVPDAFVQALRELGLCGRRPAARRAVDRRRVLGHLAHRYRAAARSAPSARWPSCASPPTGVRRSSATCSRRAGCRWPMPRNPAAHRACSANTLDWACWSCNTCRITRCGSSSFATAGQSSTRPAPWAARWHAFMPTPQHARPGGRLSQPGDLLRHPARTLPAGHRVAPCRPGRPAAVAGAADPGQSAHAGARRCQPEEHPRRCRWPGVPGCRMRGLERPGLRPGLLPQPPAAEVPLEPFGGAGLPAVFRRARRRLPGWRGLGAGRRAGAPGGAAAAGAVAGARGWQVAGGVPGSGTQRDTVRRVARALLQHPVDRLGDVAQAWRKELRA